MLQLDFQTKQLGLSVSEVLGRPELKFAETDFVSRYRALSADSRPKELSLDHQVDDRLFNSMRSAGLSALLVFADDPVLLDALKNIVLELEDELHKYHGIDDTRSSASELDLFGAIDALEVSTYFDDPHLIHSKTNRLKRRLTEWAPPTYLFIAGLNNFLTSPSISLVAESLVSKLKKAASLYSRYRNRLIQANLKLVHSVANKFRYISLPYEDLVQEGNLGLIKAVERFDHSKGFKFSTYAHIVISQSIHLALDKQSSMVRLPFKALREKATVEKVRHKLEQALGRSPSIKELDEHLPNELEYRAAHISRAVVPNANSQQIYAGPEDSELIEHRSLVEEDIKTASLNHADLIGRALDYLEEREAYIIRMRFGIGLSKEFTLEEISQTIGLSRERIRQLEKFAIQKLSRNFDSNSL